MFPNGIFEFNITKMIEHIKANHDSFPIEELVLSNFTNVFSSINECCLETVDISIPVILAEIAPSQYNLIDGNHRMGKARRMGIYSIQAYKLSVDQHIQFLTTQRGYDAYIEYWNGKLKRR